MRKKREGLVKWYRVRYFGKTEGSWHYYTDWFRDGYPSRIRVNGVVLYPVKVIKEVELPEGVDPWQRGFRLQSSINM